MSFSSNELQSSHQTVDDSEENGASSPAQKVEDTAECIYPIDSLALARLAQGSSVLIATLLAIPDGVALIPGASSVLSWVLRLIGVWISAAVLWFVGFLGILHLGRLLAQGVRVGAGGVKLWRFGRLIAWETIEAIAVEPQYFASRALSLTPAARKLTVYVVFKSGQFVLKKLLVPNPVPSFLFKPEDFDALVRDLCRRRFGIEPDVTNGLYLEPAAHPAMRSTAKAQSWQRVLVSILIALGLVAFLGRKAGVNYIYNSGNSALARNDTIEAARLYQLATTIDPLFYAPWNNLANVEFRNGDFEAAYKHWERALALKPDFVEPMVSLAYLYLQKREFGKAKKLIDRGLMLAPNNPYALVNRADYYMRLGRVDNAMRDARLVIAQKASKEERPRFMAGCILAEGLIRTGDPKRAATILETLQYDFRGSHFNKTFWLIVKAEAHMAVGELDQAADLLDKAAERAPKNADVLCALIRLNLARNDLEPAHDGLELLKAVSPDSPWTKLLTAELAIERKKNDEARVELDRLKGPGALDACLQSERARLFLLLGDRISAIEAARRAHYLEPNMALPRQILNSVK